MKKVSKLLLVSFFIHLKIFLIQEAMQNGAKSEQIQQAKVPSRAISERSE
jgi:hypothetical protein